MGKKFVGLDGEMTAVGSDLDGNSPPARLCQIGVALGAAEVFTSDIGWLPGDYGWTQQALDVNGFDFERISSGPSASEVDVELFSWLTERGVGAKEGIPVGWNVMSFDMQQFVIPTLPLTASLFSYRGVDLNSLVFALQQSRMVPRNLEGNESKWKAAAKAASAQILGNENWHDAGYDAAASLVQFYWLSTVIGGLRQE